MSEKLLQYNSADKVIGNKNVAETIITDGDIVYNESYIVVGKELEAIHIHATYDLSVLGNIKAKNISINGDFFVNGDIDADELICRGSFTCTGEIRVRKINLESNSMVDSIRGEEIYSNGNLFVRTTVDTEISCETDGLIVAGEGIMGDGKFKAKAAIANEYFEFMGDNSSKVFEVSEMKFSSTENKSKRIIDESCDIYKVVDTFNDMFSKSLIDWSQFEEEEFITEIRRISNSINDLYMMDRIIDNIIQLSYAREINNFRDFLYILCAKNIFPDGVAKYETIEPILNEMYDNAKSKVEDMDFYVSNIAEFACSLYILETYHKQLPITIEDGADKIFSSIGLRFTTVERAWR